MSLGSIGKYREGRVRVPKGPPKEGVSKTVETSKCLRLSKVCDVVPPWRLVLYCIFLAARCRRRA